MKRTFLLKTPLTTDCAIYKISCKNSDKIYIGESVNVSSRIVKHFSRLRHNLHPNKWLQNIFNKHGEESMIVEILEYCNGSSKCELRKKEAFYQNKHIDVCISFDKNAVAWNANADDAAKQSNKDQLDLVRESALRKCMTPIVVYDVKNKITIDCKSLKEAELFVEQKHIYMNIKEKKYTPYNGYVCFIPDEFDESKILISQSGGTVPYTGVYTLFDLKNNKTYNFPSKNQFSLFFSEKENWTLYDEYRNFIDWDFRTAMEIRDLDTLLNSMFVLRKKSKKVLFNTYIKSIYEYTTNIKLAERLGVDRHTITSMLKEKTIDQRMLEIENLLAAVKSV